MTAPGDHRGGICSPFNYGSAKKIQNSLRELVKIGPLTGPVRFVAGVDAAFSGDLSIGAVSLYEYPSLVFLEDAYCEETTPLPYIPGLLSFREGPVMMKAIKNLKQRPDLVLFDGQGIAHPRRLGIASHVGVLLGIPAIGCAKSRLIGDYREPGIRKGAWSPLRHQGETVGAVLRTRSRVRPVFISPGHLIDLATSLQIVMACTGAYRIPEPLRRADTLSRKLRKDLSHTT